MALEALSQETIDAAQTELKTRFLSAPQPDIKNTSSTLELGLTNQFVYRGRQYLVEPISFVTGIKLQELLNTIIKNREFQELEEMDRRYVNMCIEAMDIIWKYSVPMKSTALLAKKLRLARNPFREASDAEVMQLLSFFSKLRMLSSVRWNSLTMKDQENQNR